MPESVNNASATASLRDRAVAGAGWMVAFRLFSRLLGLAGTLVVARLLTPADFGLVAVASTITAATDSLTEFGVQDSLIRLKGDTTPLYNAAFTMQVIKASLSALILAAASPFAGAWFGDPRLGPILLVLALVYTVAGLENIGVVEFRRHLRFNAEFLLSAFPRIAGFVVMVTAAILLRSYWALVLGIATTKLARFIYSYRAHPYRPRFGLHGWRELAGMTFWTWMSALSYIVWNRADAFIIGSSLGAAKLGMIVMASDIAQLPTTELLAPTVGVLFTALAAKRNDGSDITTLAFPIGAMLLMLLAPLAIVVSAVSGDLVSVLLGREWVQAQPLVALFALLGLLAPFTHVSSIALLAGNKLKVNFAIVIVSSAVKILLLLAAVRTGDIRLVASASIGIAIIEGAIFIAVLRRHGARLQPVAGAVLRTVLACAAAVAAMAATGAAWQPASLPAGPALLRGAAVGTLGILAYGSCLLLLWRLAGCPAGAEADLIGVARARLGRFGRTSAVSP